MGWTQNYHFPNLFDLFRKILTEEGNPKEVTFPNRHIINLALHGLGWKVRIKKVEKIKVDEDMYQDIYGYKITLSNGDIYKTVIKEKYVDQDSGNYGCDYYKWEKIKKEKTKKSKSEESGK